MKLKPQERGALAIELAGARVLVDVPIPRTAVVGKMRLLTYGEVKSIRIDAHKATAHLGLQWPALDATPEWSNEIVTRTLALAIRDPADPSKPLASLSEWEECEQDQLAVLYLQYEDHAATIDPIGKLASLSATDIIEMRAAAKKKAPLLLTSFGSRKLASYIISMEEHPSS